MHIRNTGFLVVLALTLWGLAPVQASAACRNPEACVCSGPEEDTVLDAVVQPGTGPDTVWLQVRAVYGAPIALPDDGLVQLPRHGETAVSADDVGRRVLAYARSGAVSYTVRVLEDGVIDCPDAEQPLAAEDAAQLALAEWEDCAAEIREREGLSENCDDTGCATGGRHGGAMLLLLAALGLVVRRSTSTRAFRAASPSPSASCEAARSRR